MMIRYSKIKIAYKSKINELLPCIGFNEDLLGFGFKAKRCSTCRGGNGVVRGEVLRTTTDRPLDDGGEAEGGFFIGREMERAAKRRAKLNVRGTR